MDRPSISSLLWTGSLEVRRKPKETKYNPSQVVLQYYRPTVWSEFFGPQNTYVVLNAFLVAVRFELFILCDPSVGHVFVVMTLQFLDRFSHPLFFSLRHVWQLLRNLHVVTAKFISFHSTVKLSFQGRVGFFWCGFYISVNLLYPIVTTGILRHSTTC